MPASLTPTPKINTTQNDQLNILFLQGVGVEKGQKRGGEERLFKGNHADKSFDI